MEQKYKILMATMGLDIGGAETHIVELAKELKQRGYDVLIASNGGVYVPEIEAAGIRHYCVPMNRRNVFTMWQSYRSMKKIIQKEKPDIVHAHARIPGFICGKLHKKYGFPFVTSAHGVFDTDGILRYITDWGQKTIAVSEDIKQYLMKQYNTAEEDIFLTINGIDTKKFAPQTSGARIREEFSLSEGGPVICHVSRLDQETDMIARQLIELAPQLSEELPGIRLLIVGGGDVFQELKARAQTINEALGRQCVIMAGPRTDINEIVAVGDLFVGVSRAALEAMATSKPVIVAG
ncbi:MAG: glycosyltransferase, partial [Bacillota bacterium]|nr:glycosyltransferase [Bacillota bacterium]